ncbi:MAG: hypothetical protein Q9198_005011, partial [Flavoplaca austrocitrina]
ALLPPPEEEDDREGSPTPRRQFNALPGTRLGQVEVIRKRHDQTRQTQAEKEEVSRLAKAGLYHTNPLARDIQAAEAAEALGEREVRERIREQRKQREAEWAAEVAIYGPEEARYRRSEENRIRREEGGRYFITILKKKKHLDIANARDVGTFAKSVFGQLLRTADPASPDPIRLEAITVLTAFDVMITERSKRAKIPTKDPPPEEQGPENASADPHDPDVSDEAWARLQLDKQATAARDKYYHELPARQAELEAEHAGKQEEDQQRLRQEQQRQEGLQHRRATTEEAESPAHLPLQRQAAEEDEAKRRLEQERVRHKSERRKREEELARLERERRAAEEERRKRAAAQRKLRTLGVYVAGFW